MALSRMDCIDSSDSFASCRRSECEWELIRTLGAWVDVLMTPVYGLVGCCVYSLVCNPGDRLLPDYGTGAVIIPSNRAAIDVSARG